MTFIPEDPENYDPLLNPYYVRMPHRKASIVAINALLDDGVSFGVVSSGETASITVREQRALSILKQIDHYYRSSWYTRILQALSRAWKKFIFSS